MRANVHHDGIYQPFSQPLCRELHEDQAYAPFSFLDRNLMLSRYESVDERCGGFLAGLFISQRHPEAISNGRVYARNAITILAAGMERALGRDAFD